MHNKVSDPTGDPHQSREEERQTEENKLLNRLFGACWSELAEKVTDPSHGAPKCFVCGWCFLELRSRRQFMIDNLIKNYVWVSDLIPPEFRSALPANLNQDNRKGVLPLVKEDWLTPYWSALKEAYVTRFRNHTREFFHADGSGLVDDILDFVHKVIDLEVTWSDLLEEMARYPWEGRSGFFEAPQSPIMLCKTIIREQAELLLAPHTAELKFKRVGKGEKKVAKLRLFKAANGQAAELIARPIPALSAPVALATPSQEPTMPASPRKAEGNLLQQCWKEFRLTHEQDILDPEQENGEYGVIDDMERAYRFLLHLFSTPGRNYSRFLALDLAFSRWQEIVTTQTSEHPPSPGQDPEELDKSRLGGRVAEPLSRRLLTAIEEMLSAGRCQRFQRLLVLTKRQWDRKEETAPVIRQILAKEQAWNRNQAETKIETRVFNFSRAQGERRVVRGISSANDFALFEIDHAPGFAVVETTLAFPLDIFDDVHKTGARFKLLQDPPGLTERVNTFEFLWRHGDSISLEQYLDGNG